MSNCPIEETISCLAVNTGENLPNADIRKSFMIELVIVTDSWEMRVPTGQGDVPLEHAGEGQRITVKIEDGKLKRLNEEEMDPVLEASCVSEAIWKDPQIGRTWFVQQGNSCERVPRYLFTLCAAANKDTGQFQTLFCRWDKVSDNALRQLIKPKINCNDPGLSRKQEVSDAPGGSHNCHVLDEYQRKLQVLDILGRKRLGKAKDAEYTVKRLDV